MTAEYTPRDYAPDESEDHKIMKARIDRVLNDVEKLLVIEKDFAHTLKQIGLNGQDVAAFGERVFPILREERPLAELEAAIFTVFKSTMVKQDGIEVDLAEALEQKYKERAKMVYNQVRPFLKDYAGKKVLDYGAGDGQVTQRLRDKLGLEIEGFDVRDYRAPGVTVPINIYDGKSLPADDKSFAAAVLTHVMHHEKDNENILRELDRVVANRLVILETVPAGKTEDKMQADMDRTFMNDYIYNRLFHRADVPVPGTFETPNRWKSRIEKYGWKIKDEKDLGFDLPIIKDRHYLLVFDR